MVVGKVYSLKSYLSIEFRIGYKLIHFERAHFSMITSKLHYCNKWTLACWYFRGQKVSLGYPQTWKSQSNIEYYHNLEWNYRQHMKIILQHSFFTFYTIIGNIWTLSATFVKWLRMLRIKEKMTQNAQIASNWSNLKEKIKFRASLSIFENESRTKCQQSPTR